MAVPLSPGKPEEYHGSRTVWCRWALARVLRQAYHSFSPGTRAREPSNSTGELALAGTSLEN